MHIENNEKKSKTDAILELKKFADFELCLFYVDAILYPYDWYGKNIKLPFHGRSSHLYAEAAKRGW